MLTTSSRYLRPRGTAVALALALGTFTGCHKKAIQAPPNPLPPTNTVPAPTASITADPLVIDLGQSVVLNWRTTDATSVSIDGIGPVNVNGTQTVSPSNSTNFHLVARGDGGTTDANVRVTVRVASMPTSPTGNENGDMGSESAFHAAVQDVFFGYDTFELSPEAQNSIEAAARYLTQHPAIRIVIGGYCDERGSAEYNLTLGENRANAAKTALVTAGVAENRIRTVSYGKERQFCSEQSESCYQQNRRAQFMLDK